VDTDPAEGGHKGLRPTATLLHPYNDHEDYPTAARSHCKGGGGWECGEGPWWSPSMGTRTS